ncbi:MAG: hypothetical protein JO316_25555 [Abitibacteriaceae bacterium]|nr:hypothetical protein [Abditibacteriaceae bacterium]
MSIDTLFMLLAFFLVWLGILAMVLLNHWEERAAHARDIAQHSVTVEVD